MSVVGRRCGVDWNRRFRCGRPSCDRCRRRQILREARAVVQRLGARDCRFVPIKISLGRHDDTQAVIVKFRSDLRNRLNLCRVFRRWADAVIWGWFGVKEVGSGRLEIWAYAVARIGRLLGPVDVHDAMASTWERLGHQVEVGAAVSSDALPTLARGMVETAFAHGSPFEGFSDFRGLRFRYGRTQTSKAQQARVLHEPMPMLF